MCAEACNRAGYEARVVGKCGTRVRDLERRAVGDGFEETDEGNFVGGKAGRDGGGGADLRDVNWATREGREDEAMGK